MTTSNNSPSPGPKGWNCPCGCPRCSNKSNWTVHQWHFRKSEASFPWVVQTVCLLLAVVFGSYWNFRPWRNSQPQELVMGLCHGQTGTQYNVCVIIENCWLLGALRYAGKVYFVIYRNFQFSASSARKDTLPTSRYGQCWQLTNFEKRRRKWTLKTFYETV